MSNKINSFYVLTNFCQIEFIENKVAYIASICFSILF